VLLFLDSGRETVQFQCQTGGAYSANVHRDPASVIVDMELTRCDLTHLSWGVTEGEF
jgi:hypothetical protein